MFEESRIRTWRLRCETQHLPCCSPLGVAVGLAKLNDREQHRTIFLVG